MSWTTPGQGYKLKEAIKINNKPDNPGAKVGDAANRKTEYSYIYVDGVSRDQAKKLMAPRDGLNDLLAGKTMYHKGVMRFLDRKTWGTVGKNRKDLLKAIHYVILLMSSEDEELIKQQTDPSHNQWGVNGEPKGRTQ